MRSEIRGDLDLGTNPYFIWILCPECRFPCVISIYALDEDCIKKRKAFCSLCGVELGGDDL